MDSAKTAAVMSSAAAIAAALALLKKDPVYAAEQGWPPEILELLIAIASDIDSSLSKQDELIRLLGVRPSGSVSTGQGWPPNTEEIEASRAQIAALDTFYRLPDRPIPDGMSLLVKGAPTNAGIVYVARSASAAVNINQAWPLLPNENVRYFVKNVQAIYISGITAGGSVVGDFVCFTVEQKGGG